MKQSYLAFTLIEMLIIIMIAWIIGLVIYPIIKSMQPCTTQICLDEQRLKIETQMQQQEADRLYQLEQMKIQAQIEANKPTEVRVQELANQETSVWEGIATAGMIYWWVKVAEILFK